PAVAGAPPGAAAGGAGGHVLRRDRRGVGRADRHGDVAPVAGARAVEDCGRRAECRTEEWRMSSQERTGTGPIEEADLHAYVDDRLDVERRRAVEAHLAADVEARARV